jgi:hypothetical protein
MTKECENLLFTSLYYKLPMTYLLYKKIALILKIENFDNSDKKTELKF